LQGHESKVNIRIVRKVAAQRLRGEAKGTAGAKRVAVCRIVRRARSTANSGALPAELGVQGKGEGEFRALAYCAFDPQFAAVGFDDVFGDAQA